MTVTNSKYKNNKGQNVIITSGRFEGFIGTISDFFDASNMHGKIESGVTVKNKKGEKRDAFDSRIKLI